MSPGGEQKLSSRRVTFFLFRKIKTLGEDDPWLDDTAAWIERSRQLQKEKDLAEKRVSTWQLRVVAQCVWWPDWPVRQEARPWVVRLGSDREEVCGQRRPLGFLVTCLEGLLFLTSRLVSPAHPVKLNGLRSEVTLPPCPIGQAAGGDGPGVWCQHPGGGGV